MSLQISGIIHTQAEAFEALKLIAARHGRAVNLTLKQEENNQTSHAYAVMLCDGLIDLLTSAFGIEAGELRAPLRCRREVARVRQIGMYVAHTMFSLPMSIVAVGFSRDRSTVMYACHLIEDMRDDKEFDAIVAAFERNVIAAFMVQRKAA